MLSQAEIDALLSGSIEIEKPDTEERINLAELIEQGGGSTAPAEQSVPATSTAPKPKMEERQIQPYNFWSPDRFSKEQMRAIEMIHEDLGERLTASLPSFLRTNVRPKVIHTEQGRFHDFPEDLPPESLFHLITLAPLPGQMVITVSPDVAYTILELRLGGKTERKLNRRSLTEIDQLLLRGMVEHMLNDIKASWNKVVVVEPGLDDSTVNHHWMQMVMGNERVMLVAYELALQSISGTMNVYIPFTMLKPVANLLNPHIWIAGQKERQTNPGEKKSVVENLSRVSLMVKVQLGNAALSFSEMVDLKIGDVIQLDQPITQDLPVKIAERTRFFGQVGKVGNHLAIQVTEIVEPED
jgi:flagellar motor switch protein FliM